MTRASLLLVVLFAAQLHAEAQSGARAELDALKQQLGEKRAALRGLDDKERSLLVAVGELDETMAALEEQHQQALAAEGERRAELERTVTELARDEQVLAVVERRLLRRLRALYVLGEGGAVRALIGAESFEDLSYRKRLLEKLAESDALLVREHARAYESVKERQHKREALALEAEGARRRLEEQKELLAASREERKAAIARIDVEKELHVRAVKEIVERQQELATLLFHVAREQRHTKKGKGVLKEGLGWPTQGTLIRRFGTIREKDTGARITSNGIDIRAAKGAPVVAPADGTVVHSGWLRGFGRIVILDHGEGHHTLCAHLSRALVETGQMVARGETIGLVGDTESLTGAKLYFELRAQGLPIDPEPYLR